MKTFEFPGNEKPREISKEIKMIKPHKDLFTKWNRTDSNFVAGPVRETIIVWAYDFPLNITDRFLCKADFIL